MTHSNHKKPTQLRTRPFMLIIRDGWGSNIVPELHPYDATRLAKTPVDDRLQLEYPHCLIANSGEDVGLPDGTMGNSEVGHQNIGAGRIVFQESMRITRAVRDGGFFENEKLIRAVERCKQTHGKLHLMGLVSDAGVHTLLGHLYGLLELAHKQQLDRVILHAFTDGRDTPPTSGIDFISRIEQKMKEIGVGRIASVMGRFYGMDRDQRWQRVEKAYYCLRFEPPFPGEDRQIVPSPKVRTYDLKPEMSASKVTEAVLQRLDDNLYDVLVVNFANPDMVGHTGIMKAAVKAAQTVDKCVGRLLDKLVSMGGSAIVTADHGNLELMYDPENDAPFTSHTTFPVPFIVVDEKFKNCRLRQDGRLADVIPTALYIMGLPAPPEMTGRSLIIQ